MPKTSKGALRLLRGMKDILPDEERYWNFVYDRVVDFARNNGFKRLETPILEQSQLYLRSSGSGSDIVSKEMYVFDDPGGEKVALRPEGTPGIARAYVEHGMLNLPQPVKVFYFAPMFRHDRPQAGRYRQHWQFGFEVLGDADAVLDAQLIAMSQRMYSDLMVNVQVDVNSIGCSQCRPRYIKKLITYLTDHKKKMGPDDQKRLKNNPLRILDTKDKNLESVLHDAPQTVDFLCEECKDHFVLVLEYLDELDVTYNLNSRIVRGLDYYSRTTWEILDANKGTGQDALGGGGRYDDLLHTLGARSKTPAVGFACGVERMITKLRANDIAVPALPRADLFIAQLGKEAKKKALRLFSDLQGQGHLVAETFSKGGLKVQLEQADKLGAKYAMIIGQKEIVDETVLIRDMENGNQETVDWTKAVTEIGKRLSHEIGSKRLDKKITIDIEQPKTS